MIEAEEEPLGLLLYQKVLSAEDPFEAIQSLPDAPPQQMLTAVIHLVATRIQKHPDKLDIWPIYDELMTQYRLQQRSQSLNVAATADRVGLALQRLQKLMAAQKIVIGHIVQIHAYLL